MTSSATERAGPPPPPPRPLDAPPQAGEWGRPPHRSQPMPVPAPLVVPLDVLAQIGHSPPTYLDTWPGGSLPGDAWRRPPSRAAEPCHDSAPRPPMATCARRALLAMGAARRVRICHALAARLADRHDPHRRAIWDALVDYGGGVAGAAYEFDHSGAYLRGIDSLGRDLEADVGLVLSFLPINLPLYHVILFVFAPALVARQVVFHLPTGHESRPAEVYEKVISNLSGMLSGILTDDLLAPRVPGTLGSGFLGTGAVAFPGGMPRAQADPSAVGKMIEDRQLLADAAAGPPVGAALGTQATLFTLIDPACHHAPDVLEAMRICGSTSRGAAEVAKERECARNFMVRRLARQADVIIFTGASEKAEGLRRAVGEHGLLLVNGSGVNPVVVGPCADEELARAAAVTTRARLFFSGQDCAAPDAILVEKTVADRFVRQLSAEVDAAMAEQMRRELPLVNQKKFDEATRFIDTIRERPDRFTLISRSVTSTPQARSLSPVIVQQSLQVASNKRREFYAPIFHVLTYRENSDELPRFFGHRGYRDHEMCVSLFGACPWVERHLPRSRKLLGETLLDADMGTRAYGGYGPNASLAVHGGLERAGPLQVLNHIAAHYRWQFASQSARCRSAEAPHMSPTAREGQRQRIASGLRRAVDEVVDLAATADNARGQPPQSAAVFLYGRVAGGAFVRPAWTPIGGVVADRRDPVRALVVLHARPPGGTARARSAALAARLSALSGEHFGRADSFMVTWIGEVQETVALVSNRGECGVQGLGHGLCQAEGDARTRAELTVAIVEGLNALADRQEIRCGGSLFDVPSTDELPPWLDALAAKARRAYRQWQQGLYARLGRCGLLLPETPTARRWGHARDIVFSEAMAHPDVRSLWR